MRQKNSDLDLAKTLEPYKEGWVALDKEQTKVLAHAENFTEINDKIKDFNSDEVILSPVFRADTYFVGFHG